MLRVYACLALLLSVPALNACLQPESVTCGNSGVVCQQGWVCIQDLSACIDPNALERPNCGNGVVDLDQSDPRDPRKDEQCDDGNFNNDDECNWDCTFPRCGDGFVRDGEACDDGNTREGDGCSADCKSTEVCGDGIVTTYTHRGRDPVTGELTDEVKPAEACDPGGAVDTSDCNFDCTAVRCGDGHPNTQAGEDCDVAEDGRAIDTDTCTRFCKASACGDGYRNSAANEACDEGKTCPNGVACVNAESCTGIGDGTCVHRNTACCTAGCVLPGCGNGILEDKCATNPDSPAKEVCDDGNQIDGDGCSANCSSKEVCGDGVVNAYPRRQPDGSFLPPEVCDDGKHCANGTACETDSQCADIGDGLCIPRDGDGCNSDCTTREICGDGIISAYVRNIDGVEFQPEVCDNGVACANGDPCTRNADCANVAGPDKTCAPRSGDGCSSNCLSREECGDGIVNNYPHPMLVLGALVTGQPIGAIARLSEACDDGRHCQDGSLCTSDEACAGIGDERCITRSGDGCSADCLSAETCNDGYLNDYWHPSTALADVERCSDGRACTSDDDCCTVGGACAGTCVKRRNVEVCDKVGGVVVPELLVEGVPWTDCSDRCDSTLRCGDGIVEAPAEACDDGNRISGDGCDSNCQLERCGDGKRDSNEDCDGGSLRCEDGFTLCEGDNDPACANIGTGACLPRPAESANCNIDCTNARCGDGKVNTTRGEVCDTSGVATAECDVDCTVPLCGDGLLNSLNNEECDTGGASLTCNDDCTVAFCGDGRVNPARGEVCDDGQNVNGDFTAATTGNGVNCSANCRSVEVCGDGIVNDYPHAAVDGTSLPPELCDNGKHCGDGTECDSDADCGGGEGSCIPRGGDGCSADCRSEEFCGDGYLNDYAPNFETCDDSNQTDGDGCDGVTCAIESGWACPVVGQPCVEVCGDGLVVGGESCDNGGLCADNTTACTSDADCGGVAGSCTPRNGDGCTTSCQVALGWDCPNDNGIGGDCQPICGDFLIRGNETCDDGDIDSGDGCSANCQAENGWNCPAANGVGGVCLPVCGDGVVAGQEECDDGGFCGNSGIACTANSDCVGQGANSTCVARGSDGCSAICRVELGYECPEAGGNPIGGACATNCGDFLIRGNEQCDDGNRTSGDGCSSTCQFETGWECPAGFSVIGGECLPTCGDGLVRGTESCDDNNRISGDGCDSGCQAETGWNCPTAGGAGGACTTACGDGLIRGTESCDEGTNGPSGGCVSCVRQDGWSCPNAAGVGGLCATICGDGKVRGTETCDDTNLVSNDGCSSTCVAETGWTCPTAGGNGGACTSNCGDGLIRGTETCDEGTSPSAGGCLSCVAQSGWSCPTSGGNGGTCTTVCGDRLVRGAETCDDGNDVNTDGCASCVAQSGWLCPTAGGVGGSCATSCGDGIRAGTETCDDANTLSGDGCDSGCRLETGWVCTTAGQACTPVCGDGIVRGTETCDDRGRCNNNAVCTTNNDCPGNGACTVAGGDGCSATCQTEVGWNCPQSGGTCTTPTPVAADDTVRILAGQASYQFAIGGGSGLLANDTNVFPSSFTLTSATTSCGGNVTSNGTNVTYTPSGAPTCGNPQADTFVYRGCSQYDTNLCDTATVTVAINRPPVVADATTCVPVGTMSSNVNIASLFSDADNHSINLASIQATQPANTTVAVAGTLVTMTPANNTAAARFISTLTASDSATPPGSDTGTWTAVWNDPPTLSTSFTLNCEVPEAGVLCAAAGQTIDLPLNDGSANRLITDFGLQTGVPEGQSPIGSVSIVSQGSAGTCSIINDGNGVPTTLRYLPGANATPVDSPDICRVRVCEACSGGAVCSEREVKYRVFIVAAAGDDSFSILSTIPVSPAVSVLRSTLLANDGAVQSSTFALVGSTTTCGGSVVITGSGSSTAVAYTRPTDVQMAAPTCNYFDTFTYRVTPNGTQISVTATVRVTINRAPQLDLSTAFTCRATGTASVPLNIQSYYSDIDDPNDVISAVQATGSNGTAGIAGTTVTWTPTNVATSQRFAVSVTATDNASNTPVNGRGSATSTWNIVWNDPPTFKTIAAVKVAVEDVVQVAFGDIVQGVGAQNGLPVGSSAEPYASVGVAATAGAGTFGTGPVTTSGGGSCSLTGTLQNAVVSYTGRATVGADSCFVRVCEVCTGSTPVCAVKEVTFNVVACDSNDDCSGTPSTPACKLSTNTCVVCAEGFGCDNEEFCNEDTNVCAGCLDDDDCTANGNGEACLASGACGCDTTADCVGAEVCDTVLDTCVLCVDSAAGGAQDAGCTAQAKVCIGTGESAACVECNSDTHCSAGWTCTANICEPPPVNAVNDTVGFLLGASAPVFDVDDLLLNDDYANVGTFELVATTTACGGTIGFIEISGTFTYTAPADPESCAVAYTDTFSYEVCNENDPTDCDEAVVTIRLNRSPTVTDASTCVAVNTASLMLDVSTLYSDPDNDVIGSVAVTGQPSGGTVGVANTDELTLTPTNAATAATYTTTFNTCDTRTASPWHAGCDSATWTAQWNDAPTLANLASSPSPIAWSETLEYTEAQIVTTFGSVANALASMTVSATVDGTFAATATATFGGTCTIADGNKLQYTAPSTGSGTASCFVRVCEACGASPTCTTTEVKFAVEECVVDAGSPDRGCSALEPICDDSDVPVCVECLDETDCDVGEVCNAGVCEAGP